METLLCFWSSSIAFPCNFSISSVSYLRSVNQDCTMAFKRRESMDLYSSKMVSPVLLSPPFLIIPSFAVCFFDCYWVLSQHLHRVIYYNLRILLPSGNSQLGAHCFVCKARIVFSHAHHFTFIYIRLYLWFYYPFIQCHEGLFETIHCQPFASTTLSITSKFLLSLLAAISRLFLKILKAWDNDLPNSFLSQIWSASSEWEERNAT